MLPLLMLFHFFGDFVLQSREMAKNKSSNNIVLLKHVCVYSSVFLIGLFLSSIFTFMTLQSLFLFVISNCVLHFAVDYTTSRLTSEAWLSGQDHKFFTLIGLDQLIHFCCLYYTWVLFAPK